MTERLKAPVGVGVIGAGDHFWKSHYNELKDSGLCRFVAVSDLRPVDKLGAFEKDADKLLARDDVHAVFIGTPDKYHAELFAAAIEAGKHVFGEKPLFENGQEHRLVTRALASAERQGLVATSCHPRRFDPPFLKMRDYIRNRGKIKSDFGVNANLGPVQRFDFDFHYPPPSGRKGDLHKSLMYDHMNHEVDAMSFLFGAAASLKARKVKDGANEYHVEGVRSDGIAFSFKGDRRWPHKGQFVEIMTVGFEHGALAVDMFNKRATLDHRGQTYTHSDGAYKTDYDMRFRDTNLNFVRSVLGRERPYLSRHDLLLNNLAAVTLQASGGQLIGIRP